MGWFTCGRARDVVADAKCLDELFEEPQSLAAAPTDVTLEIEETAAPPPEAEEAREAGMVVAVRLRPCDGDAATAVDGEDVTVAGRAFGPFDATLGPGGDQAAAFAAVGAGVVARVLEGFHGCVMAYGATGSGKTHSVCAGRDGLLARACAALFGGLGGAPATVAATCVELYLDGIRDLLAAPNDENRAAALSPARGNSPAPAPRKAAAPRRPAIREDPARGVFLEGVERRAVATADDALRLFRAGARRRAARSTAKNGASSRSHAVYTLEVSRDVDGATVASKLHVVDLAGSERLDESRVSGAGAREAARINASLSALGNVVAALEKRRAHVPYRDSNLTRLLQDSLGGSSYTAVLCCVHPGANEAANATATLRFASRLRSVTTRPRKNVDPKDAEIARLRAANAALAREVARLTARLA